MKIIVKERFRDKATNTFYEVSEKEQEASDEVAQKAIASGYAEESKTKESKVKE